VLPTTPSAPPPLGADDAAQEAWRKKTLALTCICSLAGFPQVTLPLRADGIDGPRGVSLVMGPGRDYAALDAAVAWGARVAAAFPEIVDADATANAARSATRRDEAHGSSRALSPVTKSGDAVGEPGEPFKARGNERFKAGAFEEAAAAYGEALRATGARGSRRWRAVVFSNRAMARLKLGAYAEAEEDCGEALKLDPRNVKAHLRRGAARAVSGNYLEALEDFESALRLEPRNRDARAEVSRMKNILGEANPIPDFD
jgi:tetratricopeptide (TPR) repeat protein